MTKGSNPVTVSRTIVLVAVLAVVVAACSATSPSPDSIPTVSPTSRPSPTPIASPPASSSPDAAASLPPAGSAAPLVSGEPWLIYAWYPESLYIVRPDGSDRQRLALGISGEPLAPAWSADGERIIFVMRDAKTPNGSIWTANADGSEAALFYDGNGDCADGAFWPTWSPDGSKLAVVCYHVDGDAGVAEVSVLDPKTMVRTDLVTLDYPDMVDNPISWSPDGSTLVFDVLRWDPTDQFVESSVIATVPVTGGKVTRLTDPTLFGAHPDWSPDGKLIAFNTYDTGNTHGIEQPSNVYTIAPDGTGLRQLSTASTDGKMRLGQPFWSADGSRIWLSVGRDWETDSTGKPMNTLAWVDAASGEFHEIGTEGKRFRERPVP